MKIWGLTISRLRAVFILLLFFVLIAPWVTEWYHASAPFHWKRSLTGSLLLGGGVLAILFFVRREIQTRKEVEQRYRAFFDDAPLGTYTIDREGSFTYANRKLLEISGYSLEEMLGKHWKDVVVPEDIPLVEGKIVEAYLGEQDIFVPFEVKAYHKNQDILFLVLHYTLLKEGEEPVGFLVVVQDVTRRRKLEAQLVKSERLAVAGQLAMGLAHEINNPLAIMKTSLRLLMDRVGSGEDVSETVQDIQEEVDRIAGLVRVLLGFRDERPGEKQVTGVDEAVQSLLHLMAPQIKKSNVVTELEWAGDDVYATIRPSQFRQVLFNLVRNALDAMPEGGVLRVASDVMEEAVRMRVQDTGSGIAHKDQELLFEPFFSTKSSSHHGLGLYVCYTILKSMGGDIEVENKLGQGAAFIVTIPLAESTEGKELA